MKITIATGLYPPEIGGPATYSKMLEAELPDRDINVTVVPFGWVRHYPKIIRHFVYAWKLWRESKGSDIIYALDPVSVGLPAVWVAKLSRHKFLLRVPGDYAWEQAQLRFKVTDRLHDFIDKRMDYGFFVSTLCRIESYVANQATKVVVPSKYLKTIVEKWGVEPDKIQVIHSALHPMEVTETKDNLREKFDYSYPTIVSAGRLVPNKGFVGLLKVFSNVLKHYPQAELIIIGDGPQKAELENIIHRRNMIDSVKLMGNLATDTLGAVIRTADVFALNTAHEGLSHQLIEVMDLGTPIVTTNVGGNPELITDGVHGFLVEYGDLEAFEEALLQVLNHPESQSRMTQSARGRSKDFKKEIVIEQLVELLGKL